MFLHQYILRIIGYEQEFQVAAIKFVAYAFIAGASALGKKREFKFVNVCIESRCMNKCEQLYIKRFQASLLEGKIILAAYLISEFSSLEDGSSSMDIFSWVGSHWSASYFYCKVIINERIILLHWQWLTRTNDSREQLKEARIAYYEYKNLLVRTSTLVPVQAEAG